MSVSDDAETIHRFYGRVRSGLWVAAFILSYLVVAIVVGLHWGVEACLAAMFIGTLVEGGIGVAGWIKTAREESRRAK